MGVNRSTTNGASYAPRQLLTGSTAEIGVFGQRELGLVTTAAGNIAVTWTDRRDLAAPGGMRRIYARTSTDDGLTWNAEQQVNMTPLNPSDRGKPAITTYGTDGIAIAYIDGRESSGIGSDVYINTAIAGSASFGNDYRVDVDAGSSPPDSGANVDIAAAGSSNVYTVYTSRANGLLPDVYLSRSSDTGYTFESPQRLSTWLAGTQEASEPRITASDDGYVYAVYRNLSPDFGDRPLLLNASSDGGATWFGSETVLDMGQISSDIAIDSAPGGSFVAGWSDFSNILLARTSDGGQTVDVSDIDQGVPQSNYPNICIRGSRVIVAWRGFDSVNGRTSVFATVSDDGGANFGPAVPLDNNVGASISTHPPGLACSDSGAAIAGWRVNLGAGNETIYTSRFNGTDWDTETEVITPEGRPWSPVRLAYTDITGNNVIVLYEGRVNVTGFAIYTKTSTDGGVTFPAVPTRHDGDAPSPDSRSDAVFLASDGQGGVWITWNHRVYSAFHVAGTRSVDGGLTFGPSSRIDSLEPIGHSFEDTRTLKGNTAALPASASTPGSRPCEIPSPEPCDSTPTTSTTRPGP